MAQTQIIDIEGKRASSCIRKGQRAWTAIKATAAEQRTLWLEVGVALMYGKLAENRPGQKFSEWVQGAFPGLDERDASDAVWCAENSVTVTDSGCGLTHPSRIRRWFNEQQATKALPPELLTAPPPVPTASLPKESAVKVNKLAHRAATGDEGSAIADRMLKAFAKTHISGIEFQ